MPIYRLWRESDLKEFETDAINAEQAVKLFGQMLGAVLTLEEGPAAPQYMMKHIPKDVHWDKPYDISVYEISDRSS